MDSSILAALGVATTAGGLIGWWMRGARHGTERRVLEELYMRKVRLAENDRDEAVESLNKNLLEMRTFQGRFDDYEAQVAGFERGAQSARKELEGALLALEQREHDLKSALSRVESLREAGERGEKVLAQASHERAKFEAELTRVDGVRAEREAELASTRAQIAELSELSQDAERRLETGAAELEAARTELNEKRQALSQREARIDELSGLLERRIAEIRALEQELERGGETLAERDTERTRLQQELAARRTELEERAGDLQDRDQQLGARANEIERLSAELAERGQRLEERDGAIQKQVVAFEELEQDKDGALHEARTLIEEREGRVTELEARVAELEPLTAELESARATGRELDQTLGKERNALEKARANVERLQTRVAELQPLQRELTTARKNEHGLEGSVGKLEARLAVLEEGVAERDRSLADGKKQIASLAATAKTAQLKVDRLGGQIDDLKAKLADKSERFKTLQGEWRERGQRIKGLESDLKRKGAVGSPARAPAKSSAQRAAPSRDDLKEITGIGPALEKKLVRYGVKSYRQLAELTRDDVEVLAGKLGIGAQRIRQERWVTNAKRRHTAKYAERL